MAKNKTATNITVTDLLNKTKTMCVFLVLNNNIYLGSPLALAVFSGALQIIALTALSDKT